MSKPEEKPVVPAKKLLSPEVQAIAKIDKEMCRLDEKTQGMVMNFLISKFGDVLKPGG